MLDGHPIIAVHWHAWLPADVSAPHCQGQSCRRAGLAGLAGHALSLMCAAAINQFGRLSNMHIDPASVGLGACDALIGTADTKNTNSIESAPVCAASPAGKPLPS